jgi:diguanylate cyclase (GGDEF)-like protein/hemerythrin-like metal-binding protein/PAS domain S-box-containing protein
VLTGSLAAPRLSPDEAQAPEPAEVLTWSPQFETGIAVIDEQHRQLCRLLNELARHLVQHSDVPTITGLFEQLSAYAATHFRTEEAVWARHLSGDAWTQAHQQSHDGFLDSVAELMRADRLKPIHAVLVEVSSFLAHWLVVHILDEDKRMAIAAQAVQRGASVEAAKQQAEREMLGASRVLVDTLLSIYEKLTVRSLELQAEVTERKRVEAKLRLASHVLENTLDAICILDTDRVIEEANPAFCRACGLTPAELIGRPLARIKPELCAQSELWEQARQEPHWSGEIADRSPDGELELKWLTLSWQEGAEPGSGHFIAVFSNLEGLLHQHHELERLATQDALTGLPNRIALLDRLGLAIAHASRSGRHFAVCFLDLDGFKLVNDRLGHEAGDQLLQELSRRLRAALRGEDTVARLGGDEFVLLLGDLDQPRACQPTLQKLVEELHLPIRLSMGEAQVSASIGIAVFPGDAQDTGGLLALADQAMYRAKQAGKSRLCFHGD